jgi:hypothetical protein
MSNRSSLLTLLGIAPVAWGGLLLFTRFVAPESLPARVAFFLMLSVALISIFAPIAYFIGHYLFSSRRYHASMRHAMRQGALLALVVDFNLLLLILRSWNIFTSIIIFAAAVIVELLSLARK